ncbi:MAG: nitrilase-related carbon-nitrogen hydrolase [Candidatus Dormibacteria bacterium]|jgi:predicted amidohydrolase
MASTAAEVTTKSAPGHDGEILVALAQMAPRLGDLGANVARHLDLIGTAAAGGADLVVFPELSLTGYFLKDLVTETAIRLDGPEIRALAEASGHVDAVVGCILESDDHRFHNAAVYLSGGSVVHVHRKVYLPTYGLFDEARDLAPGNRFRAFEAPLRSAAPRRPWRAGVLICEDLWHPSSAYLLARDGVDLIICPSASPGRGVGQGSELGTAQSYDVITRTYAQLFTAYVVYCNRVGYEDGINFWGGSRAVDPEGHLLGEPAGREESMPLHRLDLAALRRARIANPMLRDERHDIVDAEGRRLHRRERD